MIRDEVARVEKQKQWWSSPEGLAERERRSARLKGETGKRMCKLAADAVKSGGRDEVAKSINQQKWWNSDDSLNHRKILSERLRVNNPSKLNWKNPDYVRKQMKSRKNSQTIPEKRIWKHINHDFPNQWQFTGDGVLIIGGKCPDFSHTSKKLLIEIFGRFWHTEEEISEREALFAKYGYKTLFIWDDELKDMEKIMKNIERFTNSDGGA